MVYFPCCRFQIDVLLLFHIFIFYWTLVQTLNWFNSTERIELLNEWVK